VKDKLVGKKVGRVRKHHSKRGCKREEKRQLSKQITEILHK
jgi:hypothetical protein